MDALLPDRLVEALRRRLALATGSPEDALRRHGEKLEAEARMRREIDRAVRLWGRTNRFVR